MVFFSCVFFIVMNLRVFELYYQDFYRAKRSRQKTSELTLQDFNEIRAKYRIPQSIAMRAPSLEWRPSCPLKGWHYIFEDQLSAWLRFPLRSENCNSIYSMLFRE